MQNHIRPYIKHCKTIYKNNIKPYKTKEIIWNSLKIIWKSFENHWNSFKNLPGGGDLRSWAATSNHVRAQLSRVREHLALEAAENHTCEQDQRKHLHGNHTCHLLLASFSILLCANLHPFLALQLLHLLHLRRLGKLLEELLFFKLRVRHLWELKQRSLVAC